MGDEAYVDRQGYVYLVRKGDITPDIAIWDSEFHRWRYFKRNKKGATELYRVEAFDKVKVTTPKDTALSDRAVYNTKSGIATLSGEVKILRGGNQLTVSTVLNHLLPWMLMLQSF